MTVSMGSHGRHALVALRGLCRASVAPMRSTSAAAVCSAGSRRDLHALPPLDDKIAPGHGGATPFLSREAIHLIATVWRQGLLDRLNAQVKDTEFENLPIAETVLDAAQDPKYIGIFNYAAESLNTAFFLHNLVRLFCFSRENVCMCD